jgi:ATP-dependent protease HslVU (ClpYQ) ATPase subunit
MSLKLDRSRDVHESFPGEICPTTGKRGVWCQDGYYFDNDGNVLPDLLGADDKKRLAIREKQLEAERHAKETLRKSLIAAGLDPDEVEINVTPKSANATQSVVEEETVDLRAWFRKEKPYPWFKVRAQLKEDYSFLATTSDAARDFLAEKFKEENA